MLNENHGVLITSDHSHLLMFYFEKFTINMSPLNGKLICNSNVFDNILIDELLQVHCDITFYFSEMFYQLDGCVIKPTGKSNYQPHQTKNSTSTTSFVSFSEYDIYPSHLYMVKSFSELANDIKNNIEKIKLGIA